MAEITLKGELIHTNSSLPEVAGKAPDFILTDNKLHWYRK